MRGSPNFLLSWELCEQTFSGDCGLLLRQHLASFAHIHEQKSGLQCPYEYKYVFLRREKGRNNADLQQCFRHFRNIPSASWRRQYLAPKRTDATEAGNRELREIQSQRVQNAKMISIGQLAAGVAHELNTPIGSVGYDFSSLKSYVTKTKNLLQMCGELVEEIDTAEASESLNKADAVGNRCGTTAVEVVYEASGNGPAESPITCGPYSILSSRSM